MKLQKIRIYSFILKLSQNGLYIRDKNDNNLCTNFHNTNFNSKPSIVHLEFFMTRLAIELVVDSDLFLYTFSNILNSFLVNYRTKARASPKSRLGGLKIATIRILKAILPSVVALLSYSIVSL